MPLFPSLVAVIVANPTAMPVTRPLPFTVATARVAARPSHTRPASALPLASRGVAVSCTVCPAATLADAGLTLTDATGANVTVTAAVPLFPSLVAVIVADPALTPVTSPLATHRRDGGAIAGPRHDPARERVPARIPRGRRELHRLPGWHTRRRRTHAHRCDGALPDAYP